MCRFAVVFSLECVCGQMHVILGSLLRNNHIYRQSLVGLKQKQLVLASLNNQQMGLNLMLTRSVAQSWNNETLGRPKIGVIALCDTCTPHDCLSRRLHVYGAQKPATDLLVPQANRRPAWLQLYRHPGIPWTLTANGPCHTSRRFIGSESHMQDPY